jgi:hypothetical protein
MTEGAVASLPRKGFTLVDFLKGYDVTTHSSIIEKTLSHEILMVWCFLICMVLSLLRRNQQLIYNFKFRLSNHVTCPWSNTLAMAKNIVYTFASFQMENNKDVARVLGVDRRNIKKVFEIRLLLETSSQDFWINHRVVDH